MAKETIFDKDDNRRIFNHFERIGYPIEFFVNTDNTYWTNDINNKSSHAKYTDDFNLSGKYVNPIIIKGNEKGDVWEFYYERNPRYWSKRDIGDIQQIKLENGKLTFPDLIYYKNTKKGGKYVSGDFISSDILDENNELASFENFDQIDAPDYSVLHGNDPQVSEASMIVDVKQLTDSQIAKAKEKLERCKKELLETLGATKAHKMYCDTKDEKRKQSGYIINDLWVRIYIIWEWKEAA